MASSGKIINVIPYFRRISSIIKHDKNHDKYLDKLLNVNLPQAIYRIITSPHIDNRSESHFDGIFFDESALFVSGNRGQDKSLPYIEISDKRIPTRNRGTFKVLITFTSDLKGLYITLAYNLFTEYGISDEEMRKHVSFRLLSEMFVAPCLTKNFNFERFDESLYRINRKLKPLFSHEVSLSEFDNIQEFNRNLFQVCATLQRAVYNELRNYVSEGMALTRFNSMFPDDSQPNKIDDSSGIVFPVWFGTNRNPILSGSGNIIGFQEQRGKSTIYGKCDVFVPNSHKFGETGSGLWKRLLQGYDDRLKIKHFSSLASQFVFIEQLKKHLIECGDSVNQGLIFIHGYNVDFEESVIRAAQIGVDLKIPLTVVYSWPSRGLMHHYNTDEETIIASVRHITDFLETIAVSFPSGTFNLIVHSMGNRGVLEAIHRIIAKGNSTVKFGKVFLAAPDVDVEIFNELAKNYTLVSDKTTLYISSKDKAVAFSKILHGSYDRVGYSPPITVIDGIDTIEVSGVDLTFLGHGYYAEAHPVIYDIKQALCQTNTDSRLRLIAKRNGEGKTYWVLKE